MKWLQFLLGSLLLVLSPQALLAQQSAVFPVGEVGSRSQKLNMVFLSEGFTQAELQSGKFATSVQDVVDYLFSKEPWNRYRSYFNIYRIEIASVESGTDSLAFNPQFGDPIPAETKNTYFDAGFKTANIDRLLTVPQSGSTKVYALLNKHVPEYDIPIVMVNSERYGGSGGAIAVASLDSYSAQLVEHEVGHSFAKLADEYDFDTPGYPAIEYPNATAKTERSQIRWNSWIEADTKIDPTPGMVFSAKLGEWVEGLIYTPEGTYIEQPDLVGLFQGSNYREVGWFRPHDNALMRSLGQPAGAVTREAFVLNYYSRVSPTNGHSPAALSQTVTKRENIVLSVDVKAPVLLTPEDQPLSVVWTKVGQVLPLGTGPTLTIPSETLGNGKHVITAEVTDPTGWIRRDPTNLKTQKITWTYTLTHQGEPPVITGITVPFQRYVGQPAQFGVVANPVASETLTYQWSKDGKAIAGAKSSSLSLPPVKLEDGGTYTVRVMGDGSAAEASVALVVVDPAIQTVVLAEGKTATLKAPVSGPVQSLVWTLNYQPIPANTAGYTGLDQTQLTISPLAVSQRGYYGILATTAAGPLEFTTHQLDVFNNPPQHALAAGASLPDGQVAASYGGEGPYFIQVMDIVGRPASTFGASGLPPGLKVDVKTGAISGKPTAAKLDKAGNPVPYAVTLSAGNAKGTAKVTVNLLVRPLPAGMVGTFVAPIQRDSLNGDLGGRFDLVVSANGSYSGKLVLGTFSQAFKGALTSTVGSNGASGNVSIQPPGKPAPPPLSLFFNLSANDREVQGSIIEQEHYLPFDGWLNPWSKTTPAEAYDGYHTFFFRVRDLASHLPTGYGGGSFTIARDGKATVAGKTPDGETFTCASHVSEFGRLVLFSLQKGKPQGSLAGHFELSDPEATDGPDDADDANNIIHDVAQTVTWWKPASDDGKARVYKGGFDPQGVRLVGGRYTPPASMFDPSDDVQLRIAGASLAESLEVGVSVLANNKFVVDATDEKVSLSVNPKLGTFTGKFTLVDDNPRGIAPLKVTRAVTYSGYFTNQGGGFSGRGFFLLPDLPSAELSDTPVTSPIRSGSANLDEVR